MLHVASWGKEARKASSQTEKGAWGLILLPTSNENEYFRVEIFYFGMDGDLSQDSPWNNRLFKGREFQTISLV